MTCPKCNGRSFRLIVSYIVNREYTEDGGIEYSELDECLGDEANSHYCTTCDKTYKDSDLIRGK